MNSNKIKFFETVQTAFNSSDYPSRTASSRDSAKQGGRVKQQGLSEESTKRVHVELFIVHPVLSPTEISSALGLEAHRAFRAGDPRKTPKGTPLPGNYSDTRWRHGVECNVTDQRFAAEATRFLDRLEPHKAFFADLKSTGGKASLIIQFFGDGYLSDELPLSDLSRLVELGLDLGVECFADPRPD